MLSSSAGMEGGISREMQAVRNMAIHTHSWGRSSGSLGMAVSKIALFRVTVLVFITTGKDRIVGKGSFLRAPSTFLITGWKMEY
jgi:hypothetical protein